jgi:chromosomal replication initiation ATPase DnaA
LFLGDKRFKAKIRKLIDNGKVDEEISQAKSLREKVSIDTIIKACESFYGKSREELVRRGKGKKERQVAIYLSKVMSGQTSKEIGRYFGIMG